MKTRIYRLDDLKQKNVQDDIFRTIKYGKNIIFPTETVYGIGASVFSKQGVEGIYKVKGRPSDNPLIMHISNPNDIHAYIKSLHNNAQLLIDEFWPGPLTLVFEKSDIVPETITGGLNTVGIRVPENRIARMIIDFAGVPICAPSANISGRPSSTLFSHVLEDFDNKVDIIVDGGKSQIGLESTVLDVTKEIPVVLRPGMVTKEMIEAVVGTVLISKETNVTEVPSAPGMKYKHYAPKGKLTLVDGSLENVVKYINNETKILKKDGFKVGVISTKESINRFSADLVLSIGGAHEDLEIASNLFAVLREMDKENIDYIFSFILDKGEYAEAIMNRLYKAANQTVIKV